MRVGSLVAIAPAAVPSSMVSTIGLDLAGTFFQIHGAHAEGAPDFQPQTASNRAAGLFRKATAVFGCLETCGGSHYRAREIAAVGHDARVKPS
ncbi:hypothetical protein [Mesorhizobium sp. WSM3879]|uniref:hypothetical protein n=1 Tax=Mesorhizobium sp. WSM3879 TaxID=2029406 RepID=UPI0015C6B76E|nr:hypothetical protein [Mesorhizobium sp. WSM3879]